MRILIVEDEKDTAALVRMLLERELEAAVDIAPDCASARELLSSDSYDLITLDYQLPDGDGLSLLEEIVKMDGAPPVVMVTGHGGERTAISAFKLGASGYVVKGTRMATLLVEEARSALARAGLEFERRQLLSIFDSIDEIVYVSDPETFEVLYANRAIRRVFGDIVGRKCYEALQGFSEPCQFCTNDRIFGEHDGEAYVWEFKNTLDGRWYRCIDRAIRWPNGKAVRYEMAIDITDRKAAEEALRRSEELYRKLVEASPEAIAVVDFKGNILTLSESAMDMFGYSEEDLSGASMFDFVTEGYWDWIALNRETLIETGRVVGSEMAITRKDGSEVFVEVNASTIEDEDGNPSAILAFIRDVTERKATEEALRQSEERVRATLDGLLSPDLDVGTLDLADFIDVQAVQSITDDFYRLTGIGVWILDLQGRILVGAGWQDICTKFHRVHPTTLQNCLESDTLLSKGVEPGEFKLYRCKNNMWDIVTPTIVGGKHVGNLFLGQFFFEDEALDYEAFRLQAKECGFDEQEYLDALERVPRWSREKVNAVMTFYAGLATIVSTLGHSNIKLLQSLLERERLVDSLKHANEELGGFAHTVSHDLKGPLSAVVLAAEVLSRILVGDEGKALEGDAGNALRIIGDNTRRSVRLIESLLELARAGQAPAKREPVDISGVIRSILEEKEPLLEERGTRVSLEGDLGVAAMDPTHAYQVFSNLIGNSIKYNESENPEIHVSRQGEAGPGALRYLVRDNGPGIPEGAEEDIFLPFHKGENSTDAGIGLSIVDKVVRLYDGQVHAYNDGGACFEFTLPLYSS